jgi:hypothetical protein
MWLKNKNIRTKNKNTRCAKQTWKWIFIMLIYGNIWKSNKHLAFKDLLHHLQFEINNYTTNYQYSYCTQLSITITKFKLSKFNSPSSLSMFHNYKVYIARWQYNSSFMIHLLSDLQNLDTWILMNIEQCNTLCTPW